MVWKDKERRTKTRAEGGSRRRETRLMRREEAMMMVGVRGEPVGLEKDNDGLERWRMRTGLCRVEARLRRQAMDKMERDFASCRRWHGAAEQTTPASACQGARNPLAWACRW